MKITREQLKETIRTIMKEESDYQEFFRKALEKAGKSIADMSDDEKKEFFNKIDAAWDGKGEKNEGNAFGAAVTAAKEKGEDEFEVGGKTYKVEEGNVPKMYVTFLAVEKKVRELEAAQKAMAQLYFNEKDAKKKAALLDKLKQGTKVLQATRKNLSDIEAKYVMGLDKDAEYQGESVVTEGRKSKDGVGVRFAQAVYNNAQAIEELVMDDKKDPKEVIPVMAPVLLNAINACLKHNYKPNAQPAYTLKRDLQRMGDISNQQRIDIFKKSLMELKKIVEALINKPSKVGVKNLVDAHRDWWNHKYGGNIALNGQGPHDNTIIEAEQKYTVIDPRGNNVGAGLKIQAAAMAKKKGGEKAGYFVVPVKNALKARRALEKFKGDFKNPKLKDIMSDLFWESKSVNEGRAFINAAKKAKEEGKTEFEFNGKTYPVTIKD